MASQYSVKMKMEYTGTDETRNYTIDDVAEDDTIPETVRGKVQALNGYLKTTEATVFVSPTGAKASAITEAKIIALEETPIEGV